LPANPTGVAESVVLPQRTQRWMANNVATHENTTRLSLLRSTAKRAEDAGGQSARGSRFAIVDTQLRRVDEW